MDIKDIEYDQYWAKYSSEDEIPLKIFHDDIMVHDDED